MSPRGPVAVPLADRFWPKVDRSAGPDACWPWLGSLRPDGYGRFRLGGRGSANGYAHRVVLEMLGVVIPRGWHVDHLCENKSCVNPAHLEPVTPRQNMLRSRGACE